MQEKSIGYTPSFKKIIIFYMMMIYIVEYKKRQNSTNGQNETFQWLQCSMKMKQLSTVIRYQSQFWNTTTLWMILISWPPRSLNSTIETHTYSTWWYYWCRYKRCVIEYIIIKQQKQLLIETHLVVEYEPGNIETHFVKQVSHTYK